VSLAILAAITVAIALTFSTPTILAQTAPSGHYDPQAQFPVGTRFAFTSFNGVAGQITGYNNTIEKPVITGYDASAVITVEVNNLTRDGGIHWNILGGSFIIDGETYTITGGSGHMGPYDRVARGMDGTAIGPNGADYHWHLSGLSGIQDGSTVIASLNGRLATVQNGAITAYALNFLCAAA
jgi:hypothetical protein